MAENGGKGKGKNGNAADGRQARLASQLRSNLKKRRARKSKGTVPPRAGGDANGEQA